MATLFLRDNKEKSTNCFMTEKLQDRAIIDGFLKGKLFLN